MRRDAGAERGFADVAVEQSPHAALCDPLAAIIDEERLLFDIANERAAHFNPRAHRLFCFRSERNDALLRSFAVNFDESRAQLDIVEIDADKLADAQSRRVQQLEKRAIA